MLCDKIDKADLPMFVKVAGDDWIAEEKFDGDRIRLEWSMGVTKLISRGKSGDVTNRYPEFENLDFKNVDSAILDGEMCVLDDNGVSQFNEGIAFRTHLKDPNKIKSAIKEYPVTYVVFDILELNGEDLTGKPWGKRREILDQLDFGDNKNIMKSYWTKNIQELWRDVTAIGGEGIILKKIDAPYFENKRSSVWKKVKDIKEVDLVFTKYSVNPRGIRIENEDGIACQCSGFRAPPVQKALDEDGTITVTINHLGQTKSGKYRQPTFKKVVV